MRSLAPNLTLTARVVCCAGILALASAAGAQETLLSSSQPASIGMSLQGRACVFIIQMAQAGTVSVFCPVTPGLMQFTGLTAKVEAAYDQKARVLRLELPPGRIQVTVRPVP